MTIEAPSPLEDISARPAFRRTLDGFLFDPEEDYLRVPTPDSFAVFNFNNLPGATVTLKRHIKDFCTTLLASISPKRVEQALSAIRVFIRSSSTKGDLNSITLNDIVRFGESLEARHRYQLHRLKEHLTLWKDLGLAGLEPDLLGGLESIRTERHEIGAAVRTMDPDDGPLTDVEYEAVIAAMRRKFAESGLSLQNYTARP